MILLAVLMFFVVMCAMFAICDIIVRIICAIVEKMYAIENNKK